MNRRHSTARDGGMSSWALIYANVCGLSVRYAVKLRLGGYLDRPNRDDPPGVETIWKGMQRMRDLAWGWQTFGPGAKGK